ncbi:MAG TPA: tetratricopeptide repeat protein [Bryobacteraceae bacterium]|nr:tetratricopeptide repeat protein [Bryobacteraceae bacterium]
MSRRRRADAAARNARPATDYRGLYACASLLLVALAAYLPAIQGSLLWDDDAHVTSERLQSLHGLFQIWFKLGATQQYYPVLHSAFWIEHRLWGDAVLGYHLVNILLHAVSAGLIVWIVRKLRLPGAWFAGFVFAVHPVYVEGVAWISEQKSALSGVFFLAAALLYLHFDRSRRLRTYWLALALFVLALLSKSVTATLPPALLVIFWWQRGRLEWRRDVVPLLPWFALAIPMGLFTAWVERTYIGATGNEFALSLVERVLLASRIVWFYAAKLIWPFGLLFNYPRWTVDAGVWWQFLFPAGLLAVAALLVLAARRNRGPLATFLLFAGTLFPVLGFLNVLPFRYSWVADHFQYLASIGLLVPLSVWLTQIAQRYPAAKRNAAAVAVAVVAVLGILTWRQAGFYRDEESLYTETLAGNPGSWFAHNNLGSVLESSPGRLTDAISEYRTAVQLEPRYSQAHFNLANAMSKLHDPNLLSEVIAQYREAIRIKPDYPEAHTNLGTLLVGVPGRLPEAIQELKLAEQLQPESAQAHSNLGSALAQDPGQLPAAIAEFQTAVRIEPGLALSHCNLGTALAQMPGRTGDAVSEFQTAVRLDPSMAEAHFLLAMALSQEPGSRADALAECQSALRLKPDFEPAQQLLQELQGR